MFLRDLGRCLLRKLSYLGYFLVATDSPCYLYRTFWLSGSLLTVYFANLLEYYCSTRLAKGAWSMVIYD